VGEVGIIENVPSVWNERANSGKPWRTTAFLLASGVGASIFSTRGLDEMKMKGAERKGGSEKENESVGGIAG